MRVSALLIILLLSPVSWGKKAPSKQQAAMQKIIKRLKKKHNDVRFKKKGVNLYVDINKGKKNCQKKHYRVLSTGDVYALDTAIFCN